MLPHTTKSDSKGNDIIPFLRRREYRLVRELGEGACGKTVLLYDEEIDEHFVCKKYSPYAESQREDLYKKFVREIKLLHKVLHPNVVRVYNYYLYPQIRSGYIMMEFVDGSSIEDFAKNHPEQINDLFEQTIDGFSYLEQTGILHRDIRPGNIMVNKQGQLKIIDLGFAKHVITNSDFDKSITLNWWCQTPQEFEIGKYDFVTEVYFVGKLFERIIEDGYIEDFKFSQLLGSMCQREKADRVGSFVDVERAIKSSQATSLTFSEHELETYRTFSDAIAASFTKIEQNAIYSNDPERFSLQLNDAYRSFMLEEYVPDAAIVLRTLVTGNYYYRKGGLRTEAVRDFVKLLKSLSPEKSRILLANLHTRLNALPRYANFVADDDDVPF